jgi:DNA-binding transcriptional regulator YiaG
MSFSVMTPQQLKERRKALGLSQAEFARAVGVSSDVTVRRWEAGSRDIPGAVSVILHLAREFPDVAKELIALGKALPD